MSCPLEDALDLLRGEGREEEVWVGGLPSQGLSFVQGESQHAFMAFEAVAPFSENGAFDLADLRKDLSAWSDAQMGKRARDARGRPDFMRLV